MVGPIGVDDAQFRQGGVAVLHIAEVVAAADEVGGAHGHAQFADRGGQALVAPAGEAEHDGHAFGLGGVHAQGVGLVRGGLAGLDGVDQLGCDAAAQVAVHLAKERVDHGAGHARAALAGEQLQALRGGIGALVELSGQVFDGEDRIGLRQLVEHVVHLRLAEHDGQALFKQRGVHALDVIAVQKPQPGQAGDAGQSVELLQRALSLLVVGRALFHIYSVDHFQPSNAASARVPMSRRQCISSKLIFPASA